MTVITFLWHITVVSAPNPSTGSPPFPAAPPPPFQPPHPLFSSSSDPRLVLHRGRPSPAPRRLQPADGLCGSSAASPSASAGAGNVEAQGELEFDTPALQPSPETMASRACLRRKGPKSGLSRDSSAAVARCGLHRGGDGAWRPRGSAQGWGSAAAGSGCRPWRWRWRWRSGRCWPCPPVVAKLLGHIGLCLPARFVATSSGKVSNGSLKLLPLWHPAAGHEKL